MQSEGIVAVGSGMSSGLSNAEPFRDVLRHHAGHDLTSSELRAGLRPIVRRAREGGATIEQLLQLLKRAWVELPEARPAYGTRGESTRRLERAITLVIETYYEA